jgi:hypothetical protein
VDETLVFFKEKIQNIFIFFNENSIERDFMIYMKKERIVQVYDGKSIIIKVKNIVKTALVVLMNKQC